MAYGYKDLGHDYHVNHGPQPEGEAMDSSWLGELDKFLKGEDNTLKPVSYTHLTLPTKA